METMASPGVNWFMMIFMGVFGTLALTHLLITYIEKNAKYVKNKASFDKLKLELDAALAKGPSLYELHLSNGDCGEYVQHYELAMYRGKGDEYFFDLNWTKNFLSEYDEEKEYWKYTLILPSVMFSHYLKKSNSLSTRNLGSIQTRSVVRVTPKKYTAKKLRV